MSAQKSISVSNQASSPGISSNQRMMMVGSGGNYNQFQGGGSFDRHHDDHGSPEIVQELLETNSEWTNIQDIIKLTFKGIYQTLKVQNDCIKDFEQILPLKADTHEVLNLLNSKANLNDIKRTMAEVASNLELKANSADLKRMLENKIDRQEVTHKLQSKISFEEMKQYVSSQIFETDAENELLKLRKRIEELELER